jgi:Cft2 family RNA processing exonuclease
LRGEPGIRALLAQGKIVPLNVNQTYEVQIPSTRSSVKVTLLPAAHCPGSVM